MGSQTSPKILSTSPSGSVVTLAMGSRRCSSPLAKHVVSQADEAVIQSHQKRTRPDLCNSNLRPPGLDIYRRTKHDPAVHMSWNVPPSPTNDTFPVSDTASGNNGRHLPSSSSSSQTRQAAERHDIMTSIPQLTPPKGVNGFVQYVSSPRTLAQDLKPQSSQVTSSDSVCARLASNRHREPLPRVTISNPPQVPPRAATAGRLHPTAKSLPSMRDIGTPPTLHRARGTLG